MIKKDKSQTIPEKPIEDDFVQEPVEEYGNPFEEIYLAVKRALLTIKNPDGKSFFRTIKIDVGQFERIIRSDNVEMEVAFPAVFIHYTNIRWLVSALRIGEARATLRIRFILNNINNQSEKNETKPFWIMHRINQAINDAKNTEQALSERCQLQFADMPTTTNMLQAYWIDYEIWFRDTSSWTYKNWIKKYIVMPPFTNYSDAPDLHPDKDDATIPSYDEVSSLIMNSGDPIEEPEMPPIDTEEN